jgi:hypothetical protein
LIAACGATMMSALIRPLIKMNAQRVKLSLSRFSMTSPSRMGGISITTGFKDKKISVRGDSSDERLTNRCSGRLVERVVSFACGFSLGATELGC